MTMKWNDYHPDLKKLWNAIADSYSEVSSYKIKEEANNEAIGLMEKLTIELNRLEDNNV